MNPIKFFNSIIPKTRILKVASQDSSKVLSENCKIEAVLAKDTLELSAKTTTDPMLAALKELLGEECEKSGIIAKMLNQEAPTMYRFVGQSEYDKIVAKQVIQCNTGRSGVYITANPTYNKLPLSPDYKITFTKSDKFNPFIEKTNVSTQSYEDSEFLIGNYSIDDIEKIEKLVQHEQAMTFMTVWSKKK